MRILLSDDLGKTFKYTLVESTENDENCVVTLPNIDINITEWGKQRKIQLPAGVIKVEVLDHIAFAITDVAPYKYVEDKLIVAGGFQIKKKGGAPSPLTFVENSKPKDSTVSCADAVPAVAYPTTEGGCATITITHSDRKLNETCTNKFTIERTFTASDGCQTITYKQTIVVSDAQAPTLTATDNCKGTFTVTPTKETIGNKIVFTWVAKDDCNNQTTHKQTITIKQKSEDPNPNPQPTEKNIIIYNGVSTKNENNYFKVEGAY